MANQNKNSLHGINAEQLARRDAGFVSPEEDTVLIRQAAHSIALRQSLFPYLDVLGVYKNGLAAGNDDRELALVVTRAHFNVVKAAEDLNIPRTPIERQGVKLPRK